MARKQPGDAAAVVGWTLTAALPLAFLGVFFAWPVTALIIRGLSADPSGLTAGGLDLSGFGEVLSNPRTWRLVSNTLTQAVLGTAGAVIFGLPVAYLLFRTRFRGRAALRGLVTIPFVLPTVVVGAAFSALFRADGALGWLGWEQTLWGVVTALVFFNVSVVVRTVGGLWERLDPRAEQAARALGASPTRAFFTVTLPNLAPAIASAAAVVFLFCATAFGVVLVLGGLGYNTIETEIYRRTTQFLDLRTAAVLSVLQLAVVAFALWGAAAARRRRERALRLVTARISVRRWSGRRASDVVTAVATVLIVGGLIVLPLAGMAARSLRDQSGAWTLANFRALGTTGGPRSGLLVTPLAALGQSLRTAALAATIAVVIGSLIALLLSRRPRRRSGRRAIGALEAFVMLPLGVSAVTVGFGFLITLDRPLGLHFDLRTSGLLIPIAQAVVATPLVVRTVLPVLRAIDPRLRQAAAVLGAPPNRVLRDVELPIALRPLGLAIGFAFAVSLGEFGATAFLARPGDPTLPVVIFRLLGRPGAENFGMALAASVLLATVTAAVMVLAETLRGERVSTVAGGEF